MLLCRQRSIHSQGYGFFHGHVWMWELDYKESWAPKNWCFWTLVLEQTLESSLDSKEIQPVHPKGDKSWVFIGSWNSNNLATLCIELTHWKRSWCSERLTAGGEGDDSGWVVGWHHWLNGHGFGWTPGVGDGQGKRGVLLSIGLQSRHNSSVTELNFYFLLDRKFE